MQTEVFITHTVQERIWERRLPATLMTLMRHQKLLLPAMNTKMAMEPAVMFLMCLTGWEVKENFITVSVSTQRQAAIRKKKMRMAQATIQKISRQWIPVGFLQKAWTMELLYLHQPTMIVVMELFPEAVQIRQKILKN